jgi:hypothetical protein
MYYYARVETWSFPTLLLAYWLQSVIIGIFQALRMIRVENPEFAKQKFQVMLNGKDVSSLHGQIGKYFMSSFFILHYGMFHFVYLIFIIVFGTTGMFRGGFQDIGSLTLWGITISGVFITTLIFFVNHLISFMVNREETQGKVNMGMMMIYPYARIIPMHLTIIFGVMFQFPLELFMGLKTVADVAMHLQEHKKKIVPKV